jgi:cysteine desulfurase
MIYLDYAATTPVDPIVAKAMGECLTLDGTFANPASHTHELGFAAAGKVQAGREQVATLLGAHPREIVFTSGATESNNLAIKGIAGFYAGRGKHIITMSTEHKAVLDPCEYLEAQGFEVTYLKPESNGVLSLDKLKAALRDDTILVSIMMVNNETGVLQDISKIAELLKAATTTSPSGVLPSEKTTLPSSSNVILGLDPGIQSKKSVGVASSNTRGSNQTISSRDSGNHKPFFHVDAAQAVGKIPLDVSALGVDLLSLSAHKLYGPKGMGVLYVRRVPKVRLTPLIHGGGHEQGLRSGTLPTHQIVGLGEACALAGKLLSEEGARIEALKLKFWTGIQALGNVHVNGDLQHTIPGILNIRFEGVDSESLLMALNTLALSTGSACTSVSIESSHVLRAMGMTDAQSHHSARFSFGRFTTEAEVDEAIQHVIQHVTQLRKMAGRV